MEKNYGCLSGVKYQNLVTRIVEETRKKAHTYREVRKNKNGCIRITLVPLSGLADEWLGGMGSFAFDAHDVCERELVFKLDPKGSHTMNYVCENGREVPVNCYGYSALKVAFASFMRKQGWIATSLPNSDYVEANGWSQDEGSVYATITLNGGDFLRIYVTVSGFQSGRDDRDCALVGMKATNDFLLEVNEEAKLNFACSPDFVQM